MFKTAFQKVLSFFIKPQQKQARHAWYAYHLANVLLDMPQEKIGVNLKHMEGHARLKIEQLQRQFETIKIISVLRTWNEQDRLYSQGREDAGKIVTNAQAGESYHNYGLAIDFMFLDDPNWKAPYERWEKVGIAAEKLGLEWGGRWRSKDLGHLEYHPDFKWQDLKKSFENNG